MRVLDIPATSNSPLIHFNENDKTLHIKGEAYPENSFEFFQPLFAWLKELPGRLDSLVLVVNVSYMNSSSTKCMLDALDLLQDAADNGVAVSAVWRCEADNPRGVDLAEEFEEEVRFPFRIEKVEG